MEGKRVNRNYTAMMAVIVLSVLLIITGALLAINPSFPVVGFIYVTSGFAIVGGCWLVLRFFMKEEYRSVSNYDFSLGILLITVGILLIIMGDKLLSYFIYVIACLLILLGVITLQFFLQCAFMRGPLSAFLNFVIAAAMIALGVALFILDPKQIIANLGYIYLGVMFAGILGLLSLLMTFVRSVKYDRFLALSAQRNEDDEPYVETYLDVKRSRDRNLEDQPFTVIDIPPEPNPGTPWNEPIEDKDSASDTDSDNTEDNTDKGNDSKTGDDTSGKDTK
ncbi:MAG: DUF308 domain-containing protein [Lachnospiraceae bacterium]|nr:DUF308 domain-containing protein [Lachnospiraceae bacterium]